MIRNDARGLRLAFGVAERSRAEGNHPFGAVLAGSDGTLLLEQGNGFASSGGDMTAHAETLLASAVSRRFGAVRLADCTVHVSAGPCAMCAGTIY